MPQELPRDGLVAVVKRDCPTCVMAAPVLGDLARQRGLTVYTQDDPSFPETVPGRIDDTALDVSHRLKIEIVPTLIRFEGGREVGRTYGWDRGEWERLSGIAGLGRDLPEARPGCGAKNVEPGVIERLKIRFNETGLKSRRIEIGEDEDEQEAMFARGWSDGLPLVPPTEERVLRMLDGTSRDPQEVLGLVPPDLAPATVEKIAINAVMAGCKPEYLPVVLAAVEAVLEEQFAMHGVLATTMFVGPVLIVNGPIRRRIGMNAKGNALGQGNRANGAIGRALQLVIRNIGGGRPQEVDRATLGNPGKYTYCFAEDEEGSSWEPLSVERGLEAGPIGGDGVRRLRPAGRRRPEVARPRKPGEELCRIAEGDPATSSWRPPATRCWWSAPSTTAPSRMPAGRRRGSMKSSTGCARSRATSSSPAPRASPKAGRLRSPARPSTNSVRAG